MKSIKEFENFKVENLKYFTGGGDTGGGERCFGGVCCSYDSDYSYSGGCNYGGVRAIPKHC